jgi:hypothetical protein
MQRDACERMPDVVRRVAELRQERRLAPALGGRGLRGSRVVAAARLVRRRVEELPLAEDRVEVGDHDAVLAQPRHERRDRGVGPVVRAVLVPAPPDRLRCCVVEARRAARQLRAESGPECHRLDATALSASDQGH